LRAAESTASTPCHASEFEPDGSSLQRILNNVFWPINDAFCGLQLTFEFPRVYTIDNLMSREECDLFVAKAAPVAKRRDFGPQRRDWHTAVPFSHTKHLQERFSDLMSVRTSQLEVTQFIRYEPGDLFAEHSDHLGDEEASRCITLFVYLNDFCGSRGATVFPHLNNLRISPKKGMGVISPCGPFHGGVFSRFLELEPLLYHAVEQTDSEKMILAQLAWNCELSPLYRLREEQALEHATWGNNNCL